MRNQRIHPIIRVIATEVLDGRWGDADVRKRKLTQAGFNYYVVQREVNRQVAKLTKSTLRERCGATLNKVYAVRIDMYYMVMGETYCECCGPETDFEFQGYVIDSLHLSKDDAEKKSKEIDIETELQGIEYEFAQVSVVEMGVNQ